MEVELLEERPRLVECRLVPGRHSAERLVTTSEEYLQTTEPGQERGADQHCGEDRHGSGAGRGRQRLPEP